MASIGVRLTWRERQLVNHVIMHKLFPDLLDALRQKDKPAQNKITDLLNAEGFSNNVVLAAIASYQEMGGH